MVAGADAAVDMACKDTSIQRLCRDRADSILKPSASERTMGARKIDQPNTPDTAAPTSNAHPGPSLHTRSTHTYRCIILFLLSIALPCLFFTFRVIYSCNYIVAPLSLFDSKPGWYYGCKRKNTGFVCELCDESVPVCGYSGGVFVFARKKKKEKKRKKGGQKTHK